MFTPGLRIGRYELGKQLGEGGFGIVFVARDLSLDRDVALKFLLPEHTNNPQLLTRFLQEARAAARIPHPGIVTVFECGQLSGTGTNADGVAFIAMELLHGESLAERLKRIGGRFAPEAAVAIARQLASGLAAAHREGIVHRDLKPDNVFLVRDPAMPSGERVKILDFGIAKLAEKQPGNSARTHSLMLLGTPLYMSPEQCRSAAHVDHRSDIYSLACIIFELLCGRTPFDGEIGELIAKHQMEAPPLMRSFVPQIPEALERLVASMLVKDPAQRLGSMAEVEHSLQHLDPKALQTVVLPPDVAAGTSGTRGPITTLGGAAGMTAATVASGRRMSLIAGLAVLLVIAGGIAVIATRGGDDSPPPAAPAAAATPAQAPGPIVTSIPIDAAIDAPIDAAIDAPVDAPIDAPVDAPAKPGKKPATRPTGPIKDDVLDPFGN
jgi:hypothetical protein